MHLFLFLLAVVILSQAGLLIRLSDAHPLAICFWRLLFACSVLIPILIFSGEFRKFKALSYQKRWRLGLSGCFLFAHFLTFFYAVQWTNIGAATLLFCLNPVTTAIGAQIFFAEKPSQRHFVSILLGFLSVAALFADQLVPPKHVYGLILGLASAAFFSAYILTGKSVRKVLPNLTFATTVYLISTALAGLGMVSTQIPFFGYSEQTWIMFILLALLPTLLGHVIFSFSLNHLNINLMSCLTLIEPILAALSAALIFAEPMTPAFWMSFSLAVMSVVILLAPKHLGRKTA